MNELQEFNKALAKAKKLAKKEAKKEKKQLLAKNKKQMKDSYAAFLLSIRERDNYTCQLSGQSFKGKDLRGLPVAHVLSKERYPELKDNPNNVLCLSYFEHKNSSRSPHLDGFVFTEIFKRKFPERYKFLINYLKFKKII